MQPLLKSGPNIGKAIWAPKRALRKAWLGFVLFFFLNYVTFFYGIHFLGLFGHNELVSLRKATE